MAVPSFSLQLADQAHDLGLDRDVERGGRLVGEQDPRVACQRHRDHHPLAHAAGHLVRVVPQPALGVGNTHQPQHLDRLGQRVFARQPLVQHDRLADLVADPQHRVERGHRLLEDHRDLVAADGAHRVGRQAGEVLALEPDRAADDAAGRIGHEAQDGERRHALAAAGFPDHAQGLAGTDRVGDAVDRPHRAAAREEVGAQIPHLQDRSARAPGHLGCRPCPSLAAPGRGLDHAMPTGRGSGSIASSGRALIASSSSRRIAATPASSNRLSISCGSLTRS